MACNCNKCNPNKNCGCNDSALTTPCSYSDCGVGSERCADVQCAECVSYCGTTFEISDGLNNIRIETGERFDSIVQKFALILAQGLGNCTADNQHHAPYNLFATDIITTDSGTSYQATIQWNYISTQTLRLKVIYENVDTAVTLVATDITNGGQPVTTTNYVLSGLDPDTTYKVYLQSCTTTTDPCVSCNSVVIEFTTPA